MRPEAFCQENDANGERAPAKFLGLSDASEMIFQGIEGWTLRGVLGQDVNASIDGDGNWLVSSDHPFLNP